MAAPEGQAKPLQGQAAVVEKIQQAEQQTADLRGSGNYFSERYSTERGKKLINRIGKQRAGEDGAQDDGGKYQQGAHERTAWECWDVGLMRRMDY